MKTIFGPALLEMYMKYIYREEKYKLEQRFFFYAPSAYNVATHVQNNYQLLKNNK